MTDLLQPESEIGPVPVFHGCGFPFSIFSPGGRPCFPTIIPGSGSHAPGLAAIGPLRASPQRRALPGPWWYPPHVPPPCVYITGCVSSERQLVTHQIRRICHTPISPHMRPPYATADSSHLAHLHPPPFVTRPVLRHMSHAPSFPRLHRHHSSLAVPTEHSLVAGLSALSAPFASTNLGHVAWDEANPPPDPPP